MNGQEKSDSVIVAVKPTNKAERSAAELVEPRAGAKGRAIQQRTPRAQNRTSVSPALDRRRRARSAVTARGGSRMREFRSYGSVRGTSGNGRPYREKSRRLPRVVETTLYRELQEGLTTIAKHASASKVGVVLEASSHRVVMIIEDDGRGFEPETVNRGASPASVARHKRAARPHSGQSGD